ncbi:hypothetical protein D5P88_06960 [Salmonella enterica subsp. enterica]|nr:hypothetical protein [Salmonella enterica subsp. enterica]
MSKKRKTKSSMETCFKILQLKLDQKLTNRCIGLTLNISPSTVFDDVESALHPARRWKIVW